MKETRRLQVVEFWYIGDWAAKDPAQMRGTVDGDKVVLSDCRDSGMQRYIVATVGVDAFCDARDAAAAVMVAGDELTGKVADRVKSAVDALVGAAQGATLEQG